MLRVQNQAKQAAHFGPSINISFPEETNVQLLRTLSKKIIKRP
jgi:hypothetical protein